MKKAQELYLLRFPIFKINMYTEMVLVNVSYVSMNSSRISEINYEYLML